MKINKIIATNDPKVSFCALSVTMSGLNITVTQGDFVIGSKPYSLTEDEIYVWDGKTYCTGYLVEADGEIRLFVDERVDNAPHTNFRDLGFQLLHSIWDIGVDASNNPVLTIKSIIPPPDPQLVPRPQPGKGN